MDPISSTYGSTSTIDAFNTYRTPRQGDSYPQNQDGTSSTQISGGTDRNAQLGIQPSGATVDEFLPYGPNGLQKKDPKADSTRPEANGSHPALSSEAKQQDTQTQQIIARMKATEEKVKAHEAAHKSGGAATGPISYTYTRGPDGKNYISGGEVPITISSGQTPQETISRMQQVIQAALAPADPSPQDRAVAAQAAAMQQTARQEQAGTQSANGDAKIADIVDYGVSSADTSGVAPDTGRPEISSGGVTFPDAASGLIQPGSVKSDPSIIQSRQAYRDPAVTGKNVPEANKPGVNMTDIIQERAVAGTLTRKRDADRSGTVTSTISGSTEPRQFSLYR
jgi:hypothetical protein